MASPSTPASPLQSDVTGLLDKIAAQGRFLSQKEEGSRQKLIDSARSLIAALETPMETITWLMWAEPTRNVASRVAIDLGIFERLAENEGYAKSTVELASVTGAEPDLVRRIVRHLAAMKMIKEVGPDSYAPTELSRALAVPRHRDGIPFCFDCAGPVFQKLPKYLASTSYKNPTDTAKGPFQYAHETELHGWEWMSARPEIMRAFQNYMSGLRAGKPSWMDHGFYPVAERLELGLKETGDSSAIVDVGGSLGHDLEEFKSKYPQFRGRLVLQDQPQVIAQISQISKRIEATAHDFFTPQPIKGARAYFLKYVLHDWPDDRCREILSHLITAMEPGYSKLLINEAVIPDVGASWTHTSLDLFMLALASSTERTEAQWRTLLGSVGLTVTGIWSLGNGEESLIEATHLTIA